MHHHYYTLLFKNWRLQGVLNREQHELDSIKVEMIHTVEGSQNMKYFMECNGFSDAIYLCSSFYTSYNTSEIRIKCNSCNLITIT